LLAGGRHGQSGSDLGQEVAVARVYESGRAET
jgi:hypothetical protein